MRLKGGKKMYKGVLKKTINMAGSWIKKNRIPLLQMATVAAFAFVPHATSFANDISTNMPWDKGVNAMQSALTGPLPKAGSAISVAAAGILWMFGESQVTKVAMRVALGSGVALAAPSAVSTLSGVTVSGCLF